MKHLRMFAALALTLPAMVQAQAKDTVDDLIGMVSAGMTTQQIVSRFDPDCARFTITPAQQQKLTAEGAGADLIPALRAKCSGNAAVNVAETALEVRTDPGGAMVYLGGRFLGRTTPAAPSWSGKVPSAAVGTLEVKLGEQTQSLTTELPANKAVVASFAFAKDTTPWPQMRTAAAVADELGLFVGWTPSTPRPVPPVEPAKRNGLPSALLWGLVGGAAGYAVGQFVPAVGCVKKTTLERDSYVDGQFTRAGTSIDQGKGPMCTYTTAGSTALGLALFSAVRGGAKHSGRVKQYRIEQATYGQRLADWELSVRDAYALTKPEVRNAMERDRQRFERTKADNQAVLAYNANLPAPSVRTLDVTVAQAGTGTVTASKALPPSELMTTAPRGATKNDKAVAVVIGNSVYKNRDVPPVDFAARDAEAVRRYLVETFGYDTVNVIFELNATSSRMNEIFGTAANPEAELHSLVTPKESDVFVFYSGHGAPDTRTKKPYLVPVDANPSFLAQAGYPLEVLYANLAKLDARSVTIALDACFSGFSDNVAEAGEGEEGARGAALIKGASPALLMVDNPVMAIPNAVAFSAAASDQISSWYNEKGHGLFTWFFLKGIGGDADADADRRVSAEELNAYLQTNVTASARRLRKRKQTPQFAGADPKRVLTQLTPAGGPTGDR